MAQALAALQVWAGALALAAVLALAAAWAVASASAAALVVAQALVLGLVSVEVAHSDCLVKVLVGALAAEWETASAGAVCWDYRVKVLVEAFARGQVWDRVSETALVVGSASVQEPVLDLASDSALVAAAAWGLPEADWSGSMADDDREDGCWEALEDDSLADDIANCRRIRDDICNI